MVKCQEEGVLGSSDEISVFQWTWLFGLWPSEVFFSWPSFSPPPPLSPFLAAPLFLKTLAPIDYVFSSVKWSRKFRGGCSGGKCPSSSWNNALTVFSWTLNLLWGRLWGHAQRLFSLPVPESEGIFGMRTWWDSWRLSLWKCGDPTKAMVPRNVSLLC